MLADQFVVPVAVPLPTWLFGHVTCHVTCVTPTLSDALPPIVISLVLDKNVKSKVGLVMLTLGLLVSAPAAIPDQPRRMKLAAITSATPRYRDFNTRLKGRPKSALLHGHESSSNPRAGRAQAKIGLSIGAT